MDLRDTVEEFSARHRDLRARWLAFRTVYFAFRTEHPELRISRAALRSVFRDLGAKLKKRGPRQEWWIKI